MKITVEEINESIKKIFDESKLTSIDSVYEKIENSDDLKLIIFFHNIFYDNINLIYSKIIFITDKDKIYLTKNNFVYLYDINCEYKRIDFEDIKEFENKIKKVFNNKLFGENIKTLSDFMKSPSTLVNKWLSDNNITDKSVFGFKYEPKITIMPCKNLFFNFVINVSDKYEIYLVIVKENSNNYKMTFKVNNKEKEVEIDNLNMLIREIGIFIKENI
jgi:hypothetical protein